MPKFMKLFPAYIYMTVALKFLFIGIATGEFIYILLSGFLVIINHTTYTGILFFMQLIIIAFMVLSLLIPNNLAKVRRMFCGRWDLILCYLIGSAIPISFQGFYISEILYKLTGLQYILIELGFFIPFAIKTYYQNMNDELTKQEIPSSSFFNDTALNNDDDLLQRGPLAEDFANKIYDNKSANSIIWGVEGPWGIGKSSFINLCEKSLQENHPEEVIVGRFNALKYSGKYKDISTPLSEFLRETVYEALKCPELDILLAEYQKLVKGIGINVLGISLNVNVLQWNASKVFTYISATLKRTNKKFIFVIDDLDRLNEEEVYTLLYSIKEIFNFPFINYILCYDLDNLSKGMGTDKIAQKNVEFLEKFVQVKVCLFVHKTDLLHVLDENINALATNMSLDVEMNKKALTGIKRILQSDDAPEYMAFLGDLRKIKRFINTLTALDIQSVDFPNYDFDEKKLTELILLYMYFPAVFRKIYMKESWSRLNYFTSYPNYVQNKPMMGKDVASELDRLKDSFPGAEYLLRRLFSIDESKPTVSPTFTRNALEVRYKKSLLLYMDLIVDRTKKSEYEQTNFYINCANKYLKNEECLDDVFKSLRKEVYHAKLWRVLAYHEFANLTKKEIAEIIQYGLNIRMRYSYTGDEFHIGLKNIILSYFLNLFRYLNHDRDEQNTKKFIVNTIFGANGIIDVISQEKIGILGIYDLLQFRLRCCYSRHIAPGIALDILVYETIGSFENSKFHVGSNINVLEFTKDEMRAFTQRCFSIFKKRYMDRHINFMKMIYDLTPAALEGDQTLTSQETIDSSSAQKIKNGILTFITYQIGNCRLDETGIGCGYYDEKGMEDKKGIRRAFSKYLFSDVFVDSFYWQSFLLILAKNDYSLMESGNVNCDRVIEAIEEEQLKSWWLDNREKMMELNLRVESFKLQANGISSQEILKMYGVALDEKFKSNPDDSGNINVEKKTL